MDMNGLVNRVANIRSACIELENHKPIQLVMKSVPEAWYMAGATANKWNDERKAVKAPTLLQGEALASWLELRAEVKKSYANAREELLAAMTPTIFCILERFRQRKWSPAERSQCSCMT